MGQGWATAPPWLKVLCILGVPWLLAGLAIGLPLLVTTGPGLPVIILGTLGLAPWLYLLMRDELR